MAMASSENPQVEIIEFKYPRDSKLYLPKISWPDTEMQLNAKLAEKFERFGPLYQVTSKLKSDGDYYAYVMFYAKSSADRARLMLDRNLLISGSVCRVLKGKCTLVQDHPLLDQPLAKDKCVQLANHYLGFNGWSTQVMYHQVEEMSESPLRVKYGSAVRLTIQNRNATIGNNTNKDNFLVVDGVGLSASDDVDDTGGEAGGGGRRSAAIQKKIGKGQAMSYAGKCSLNAAFRNAFSRVILVVVDGRKVKATLNTEVDEPFAYNPTWNDRPGIKVNEITLDEQEFQEDPEFDQALLEETEHHPSF